MVDRPSGMELMLRSLMKATGVNPDEVFSGINELVASGALHKIVQFADALPEIVERLNAIERRLATIDAGTSGHDPGVFDGRSRVLDAHAIHVNGCGPRDEPAPLRIGSEVEQ